MRLTKRPPKPAPALFHQVRDTPQVAQALAKAAAKAGISSTEALRQIIGHYVEHPFAFTEGKTAGAKTAVWSNIKADPKLVAQFTKHAITNGVTVAEGIRQAVRRHLKIKTVMR